MFWICLGVFVLMAMTGDNSGYFVLLWLAFFGFSIYGLLKEV